MATNDFSPEVRARELLKVGPLRLDVERFIYGTVSLLTVLAVFEGWGSGQANRSFIIVIVGPTTALFLAHLYATVIDEHFQLRRRLKPSEWMALVRHDLQFYLVPVPLCIVFAASRLLGADVTVALRITMFTGIASLAILVAYAAYLLGIRRWPLFFATLGGLVIGATILAIELLLAKAH